MLTAFCLLLFFILSDSRRFNLQINLFRHSMIKHLKHTKYQKKLVTASDPLTEKKLLKSTYTRPYFTIAHDS